MNPVSNSSDGLSSVQADERLKKGEDWFKVAQSVLDENWWLKQSPPNAEPLTHQWKVNAHDATLIIEVEGYTILVDPGPFTPDLNLPPDLILITHAHYDHIGNLFKVLQTYSKTLVVLSSLTFEILELLLDDIGYKQLLNERSVKLNFFQPKVISNFEVEIYPAGHVLGACMFSIYHQGDRILISGDFSLRDIGGLPGCSLPEKSFGLFLMSISGFAERDSFPSFDPRQNYNFLLSKILRWLDSTPERLLLSCSSIGEAQEAYAALTYAQREGKLKNYHVRLHGMVYKISDLYYRNFPKNSLIWKIPPYKLIDIDDVNYIGLLSQESFLKKELSREKVFEISEFVFTHASWSERLTLALSIPCHSIYLYHGTDSSIKTILSEIGCKVSLLP